MIPFSNPVRFGNRERTIFSIIGVKCLKGKLLFMVLEPILLCFTILLQVSAEWGIEEIERLAPNSNRKTGGAGNKAELIPRREILAFTLKTRQSGQMRNLTGSYV